MSFHLSKGTPDGRRKEGCTKRLSYPVTCQQRQKENRALSNGRSQVPSRSLTSFRRVSPYQPNEGLFDRESVLGMVSRDGGAEYNPEYGSDSELDIDNDFRSPAGCRPSLPSQLTTRSPLMDNTSLLNQQPTQQANTSVIHGSGVNSPQNVPSSTIIAMLQEQQHLLQEVISTQQGMLKKQSDFDHKLLSLQHEVLEGLNSCSSVASSNDDKKSKLHVI